MSDVRILQLLLHKLYKLRQLLNTKQNLLMRH